MKSLRRIVSLCTAGALAVGMTCDMASNGYASKSVISIENSPTGSSEELIAEESYLLNKDYVGISSPKDYNNDGVIDVFDMIQMKKLLISPPEKSADTPQPPTDQPTQPETPKTAYKFEANKKYTEYAPSYKNSIQQAQS